MWLTAHVFGLVNEIVLFYQENLMKFYFETEHSFAVKGIFAKLEC